MIFDKAQPKTKFNHLNVRTVKDNGKYHREVVECGDYTRAAELNIPSDYTDLWTEDLVSDYKKESK